MNFNSVRLSYSFSLHTDVRQPFADDKLTNMVNVLLNLYFRPVLCSPLTFLS